ncbi:MAG: hypothetical protein KBD46_00325 [Candidatus Levybacteria bacterium]|nr:hypothetical protein [Candidatus Levybacteria bacterium]
MNESEFLIQLQKRATEQERLIKNSLYPQIFLQISNWFGKHPWRVLIPAAFLISLLLRFLFGHVYFEKVLYIFGGA